VDARGGHTRAAGASPSEVAVISRLAIDPRHRGGIAIVSLFREAFRLLMEQHPKTSLIFILAMDNPRLLSLYRMLGFERLDEHLFYPSDLGPTVPMCAKVNARVEKRHRIRRPAGSRVRLPDLYSSPAR
jgi:ribosomal protein S18 acetylase RimI-like enzyme